MDRLKELASSGFGEVQLGKLVKLLAGWTAKSGLKPAEAVDRFLDAASRVTDILFLEQERARAEREKTVAEAEAKKAIAQSKLTTEAVEATKWLVSQRISTKTVLAWRAIAVQLSLAPDAFPHGMADALKQYGTLEAACRTKTAERDELSKQVEKLKAETATLQAEKQRIRLHWRQLPRMGRDGSSRWRNYPQAHSVKDQAVAAIKSTYEQFEEAIKDADKYMAGTIQRFQQLTKEAAELEQDVGFVKALRSSDSMTWLNVTAENWDATFSRFLEWARVYKVNAELPIPDGVKKAGKGSVEYTSLYGQFRLPLSAIMEWLRAGLRGSTPIDLNLATLRAHVQPRLSGKSSLQE